MNLAGIGTQLASNLYSAGSTQLQQLASRQQHASAGSPALDSVSLSGHGLLLSRLQSLQASDPAKFRQVLTETAGQLQSAAHQEGNTPHGRALGELATKFQNVANGGDLSQLRPATYPNRVHQAYGTHQANGVQEVLNSLGPGKAPVSAGATDPHYVLKSALANLSKA